MVSLLLAVQMAAAAISGTVRDAASGEPLGGAIVSLTDVAHSAVTDELGRYRLEGLPPGSHRLIVRRIGYAPRELEVLLPRDGSVTLAVTLRADPVTLGTVNAGSAPAVPARMTGAAEPWTDRRLSAVAARDHPLLAEPDMLAGLTGGAVAARPEAPSGLHVRGGASDQIAYLLDGIPVFSPYHTAGTFSAWNPDALDAVALERAADTWDALAGVVTAATREPGAALGAEASLSTTQARLTVAGPLGTGGAGFLGSVRSGFPGAPRPKREGSYVHSEMGDWLAKLEVPVGGGRARLLGYESANAIDAAATGVARNAFAWRSRSIGAEWTRPWRAGEIRIRVWDARQDADATWHSPDSTQQRLTTLRRDQGLTATLDHDGRRGHSRAGIRLQTSRTAYRVAADTGVGAAPAYDAAQPLGAVFVERRQHLASGVDAVGALTGAMSGRTVRWSPRAWLGWSPMAAWRVSVEFARLHQFAQSLRNPESIVGAIFPAELYVGAGQRGMPIARSDEATVAVVARPAVGLQIDARAYARLAHGLALVGPHDADPFATTPVTVGGGTTRGFEVALSRAGARYGFTALYGWQRVRLTYGDTSYVPDQGTVHALDAGIAVRPTTTLSLRLGASVRAGRRGTALSTPLEWESCNLSDGGCEFAGSPRTEADSLGARRLPTYIRVDFGARRRWRVHFAGRDGELALFGTVSNVFGRHNVLTLAPDAVTGARTGITLRPRAPLVLGLDWSF